MAYEFDSRTDYNKVRKQLLTDFIASYPLPPIYYLPSPYTNNKKVHTLLSDYK
ncbi:MAG: hypothetical protein HXN25_01985 [Prevotella aurantiaca]|nr:hypothetical protein [Prevotella aurantiaca]